MRIQIKFAFKNFAPSSNIKMKGGLLFLGWSIILFAGITITGFEAPSFAKSHVFDKNYFMPDSIPGDTSEIAIDTISIDTINVTEVYYFSDTIGIYTDGLDSIIYTQGDTSGFYIGVGNTETFYVGESDSDAYETILSDSTLAFNWNDSTSYYIATDSSAYFIPKGENSAYALLQADPMTMGKSASGVEVVQLSVNQNINDIYISLSHQTKIVNQGLLGVHVGGMFDPKTTPNEPSSMYAWQWLVDLAPTVLRFPQGSGSKFMHLLHYADGSNVTGYGYDIIEIARYFDYIDGSSPFDYYALTPAQITEIENAVSPVWIRSDYRGQFNAYHNKWADQQCEDVDTKYIDDFITLVQLIDAAYPGRPKTKVIIDLNIISEPASECRAIADYMRSANVNVVGVEMGNECYASFFCDVMGFFSFGNYWSFINGTNLPGNSNILYTNAGITTDMIDNHDFISAFKNPSAVNNYNYKIGMVGMPLGSGFAFEGSTYDPVAGERSDCNAADAWNPALYSKYGEIADGTTKYKFDAVIMHTYYETGNWKDIVLGDMNPVTVCGGTSDLWKYDVYDTRLQAAFNGIIGIDNQPGNFKNFIIDGKTDARSFSQSFDKMNDYFNFTTTETNPKDLWITEWNLKDYLKDGTPSEIALCEAYSNTFSHAFLLFQWWLKEIKVNYNSEYRENFFTYSTVQNYINGTSTDLVSLSNQQERDYYGKTGFGGENCDQRNYHTRRTSYFVMYLLSEIAKENLKYLKTTNTLPFLPNNSGNIQPTTFIDQQDQYLYVYYTNMRNAYQNYRLYQGTLKALYPTATDIVFDDAATTNVYIKGSQLYSTSGRATLFQADAGWVVGGDPSNYDGLNDCYETNDHPMELTPATEAGVFPTIHNYGNYPQCIGGGYETLHNCLTAEPYSMGYFKVHFIPMYPLKEAEINELTNDIIVYPNPTSSVIYIGHKKTNKINGEKQHISIYNIDGKLQLTINIEDFQPINVANLPSGLYQIVVRDEDGNRYYKKFIKID